MGRGNPSLSTPAEPSQLTPTAGFLNISALTYTQVTRLSSNVVVHPGLPLRPCWWLDPHSVPWTLNRVNGTRLILFLAFGNCWCESVKHWRIPTQDKTGRANSAYSALVLPEVFAPLGTSPPRLTSPHKQVTLNIYIRFLIHINVKNICLLYFEGSGHSRFLSLTLSLSQFDEAFAILRRRCNVTGRPPGVSPSHPTPPRPIPHLGVTKRTINWGQTTAATRQM